MICISVPAGWRFCPAVLPCNAAKSLGAGVAADKAKKTAGRSLRERKPWPAAFCWTRGERKEEGRPPGRGSDSALAEAAAPWPREAGFTRKRQCFLARFRVNSNGQQPFAQKNRISQCFSPSISPDGYVFLPKNAHIRGEGLLLPPALRPIFHVYTKTGHFYWRFSCKHSRSSCRKSQKTITSTDNPPRSSV